MRYIIAGVILIIASLILMAYAFSGGCVQKDAIRPQVNSPTQEAKDIGSGHDTYLFQLAGSGWPLVAVVVGVAWILLRRQKQNVRGIAKSIESMGAGKQRDRLLGRIEENVPHRKLLDRTIQKFRVKREGVDHPGRRVDGQERRLEEGG